MHERKVAWYRSIGLRAMAAAGVGELESSSGGKAALVLEVQVHGLGAQLGSGGDLLVKDPVQDRADQRSTHQVDLCEFATRAQYPLFDGASGLTDM